MSLMDKNIGSILAQSLFSTLPFIFTALLRLWPLLLIASVITVGPRLYRLYRFSKAGMGDIDKMDGLAFENYLTSLFQKMGYSVKHVGTTSGDYGADLIIQKGQQTIAVQAKRHKTNIGEDAVREALGSIKMYKCNSAMVVTNNYFSRQSKKLAQANGVVLWNRNTLTQRILKANITNKERF
jgi:restriction system protein